MKIKDEELFEWYWKTEEYKEWIRLAHQNKENKSNGYWCYNSDEQKWKYIYPS